MTRLTESLLASYRGLICRLRGHDWIVHDPGHVHADDDWNGPWKDGHPWFFGLRDCARCGETRSL